MFKHVTVLLHETVDNLEVKPDGIYVDCTLGGAGHSEYLLSQLTTGHLYCFDQDMNAIDNAKIRLEKFINEDKVTFIHANFRMIQKKLNELGIKKVDGILYDLGVSSPQLDQIERGFSYHQNAILDMRMVRLTGLEREKIDAEYADLQALIKELNEILASEERRYEIIEQELLEIQQKFDNPRRTELLVGEALSLEDEDLIEQEDVVITLTKNGYIKRLANSEFKTQRRGGRGVQGMSVHDDDFVENMISCSTHDSLLFFTNTGKVYQAKGYEIPEYSRTAKGLPVINLLNIDSTEKIQAIISVPESDETERFLFFTTLRGTVKRVKLSDFKNIRTNGLRAIQLREDDQLIRVVVTSGQDGIILGTYHGNAVTFHEEKVRAMGRTAAGVRGVSLRDDDYVIGMDILTPEREVLVVSEKGYGKRTAASEYALKGRGGKGVKTLRITEKNGPLVCLRTVTGEEDLMIMTNKGVIIRFHASDVSQTGRGALGVRMMRLDQDAIVSSLAIVDREEEAEETVTSSEETIVSEKVTENLQNFAQELVDEQE